MNALYNSFSVSDCWHAEMALYMAQLAKIILGMGSVSERWRTRWLRQYPEWSLVSMIIFIARLNLLQVVFTPNYDTSSAKCENI